MGGYLMDHQIGRYDTIRKLYYKISQIRTKSSKNNNMDIFNIIDYRGETKEYEVNNQFTILNNLLQFLVQGYKSVDLIIKYENHIVEYVVGINQEFAGGKEICNCLFERIEYDDLDSKKINLVGGVPVQAIHRSESNVIDDLINMFPEETFAISVSLNAADIDDVNEYKGLLQKNIRECFSFSRINSQKIKNILKQFEINIMGGTTGSKEIRNVSLQETGDMLLEVFFSYNIPVVNISTIEISGEKSALISDYLQSYSDKATNLVGFFKLKPEEEIANEQIKIDFIDDKGKEKDTTIEIEKLKHIPLSYISSIFAFPTEPTTGITQLESVQFGERGSANINGIVLGNLVKGSDTNLKVTIDINDFTKHAFVTGVTGSGKTTTIKFLLEQVIFEKVPFLILEPAKNEYKHMKFNASLNYYNLGGGKDGLRINPLYFPEGLHIQTHIDHIKSIFVAAFPMYGPMPYILETAIYNVYRKKGWDLITSKTLRENDRFPTLEDLLYEIDIATDKIGYSEDLQSDVKGALKVRINSLISGSKGNVLNCSSEDSIGDILAKPTIISLESIGDAQEKIFLMGLILVSIYEQYVSEKKYNKKLKNLMVIEEAHRLLENVQANNNPEIADMKGKALETFNNILSEIRAYGQGIVIADQIATKLSSDVIKNTNLKIVHRLFSKDDREIVGHSIGLKEEQINHMVHLKTGEAIIFHSGMESAVKVFVPVKKVHFDLEYNRNIEDPSDIETYEYNIVDNPFSIEECYKWLKLGLLLDLSLQEFYDGLTEILNDFVSGKQEITNLSKKNLMNKISRKLINETGLIGIYEKNYAKQIKLQDDISESPYEKLTEIIEAIKDKDSLVPEANIFALFYPTDIYAQNILSLKDIVKYNEFAIERQELINASRCERAFAYYMLDERNKIEVLSDCIVYNVFGGEQYILDLYFNIGDLRYDNYEDVSSDNNDNIGRNDDKLFFILEELSNVCKNMSLAIGRNTDEISKYISASLEEKTATKGKSTIKNHFYLPFIILGTFQLILIILLIIRRI